MKNMRSILLPLLLLVIGLSAFLFWRSNRQHTDMLSPGQGPSEEQLDYMDQRSVECPIWALDSIEISENVEIVKYECDYIETGGRLGESITLEIYTQDLEQGKQEFRDWLAANGLKEGDRLRVTYEHKPQ